MREQEFSVREEAEFEDAAVISALEQISDRKEVFELSDCTISTMLYHVWCNLEKVTYLFPINQEFGNSYKSWLIDDPRRIRESYDSIYRKLCESEHLDASLIPLVRLNILYSYNVLDILKEYLYRKTEERKQCKRAMRRNTALVAGTIGTINGLFLFLIRCLELPEILFSTGCIGVATLLIHALCNKERSSLTYEAYRSIVEENLNGDSLYDFPPLVRKSQSDLSKVRMFEKHPFASLDYAIFYGKFFSSPYTTANKEMHQSFEKIYKKCEEEFLSIFPFFTDGAVQQESSKPSRRRKTTLTDSYQKSHEKEETGPTIITLKEEPNKKEVEASNPEPEKVQSIQDIKKEKNEKPLDIPDFMNVQKT